MKIGILETGILNEKLSGAFPSYPVMFEALLNRAGKGLNYQAYSVIRGEMPDSASECDGWLITGSRHGVYENLLWMLELQGFIRNVHEARIPLVGICSGHQIIAQALGGEVTKSDKGWGVGVHTYEIDELQSWMAASPEKVRIYAFHQDQVTKLPPQAKVYSSSAFCPYAGITYGDSIFSMQAHPEFEEEYELALLNLYGGELLPGEIAEAALDAIRDAGEKADTQMLAEWIVGFLLTTRAGANS